MMKTDKKRTIVIGDIHGCYNEFMDLLDQMDYAPESDRLISCGDLIDRGPNSKGVIDFCRKNDIEVILGNHEDKLIRYWEHEQRKKKNPNYINPMRSLNDYKQITYDSLTDDDFEYLRDLPVYVHLNDRWKVIHGGLETNKRFLDQKTKTYPYVRYVDINGNAKNGDSYDKEGQNLFRWAELWPGPESIIYGHYVHSLRDIKLDEPFPGVFCVGIDTGCCFGGRLTAISFYGKNLTFTEGLDFTTHQVQARKDYFRFQN